MRRALVPACFAPCFCIMLLSAAHVPNQSDAWKSRIAAIIDSPEYRAAHWGILVADLETGETLYELQPDKLFAPASVTKLFSVAAALEELGPEYRFHTPVFQRGKLDGAGVLHGDLILVASGDPTLGGRTDSQGRVAFKNSDHTYANGSPRAELTTENPLAGLDALAEQVAKNGITRINGDILIDDRLFEKATSTGSGPRTLSPTMLNDNLLDFTIAPGKPGERATVEWRPRTIAMQVDAQVDTIAQGEETKIEIKAVDSSRLFIRGKIAANQKPSLIVREVPDAAAFARALFVEALGRRGIRVEASVLAANEAANLPSKNEYASMTKVAEFVSPPFTENAKLILKVSHNLHASTLPLLLAVKHGERRQEDGLRRQGAALKKLGVEVEAISFGGGAGGSNADYVTPRATVQLLRAVAKRPYAAAYAYALPILGVDGTLSESVAKNSPARGKVRAKTGTLSWTNVMNGKVLLKSKALAGYLTTSRGRKLAFAIFVNHAHLDNSRETDRVGRTLGKLCEIIHE